MLKKIALCAIVLGIPRTLLCTDKNELRAQLAAKDAELEGLDAAVQKQEARYTTASDKFVDLRERCIQARKNTAQKRKSNKTDEQIRADFFEEVSRFSTAYYNCSSPEGWIKGKDFFGDFCDHGLLKYYLIKTSIEYLRLLDALHIWESCSKERFSLLAKLETNA